MHLPISASAATYRLALALSSILLSRCGGEDVVESAAESYDRSATVLTGAGGVPLAPIAVKGTYGSGCKLRAGQSWSLKLNDPTDKSLQVALNDSVAGCALTMTSLQVQSGTQLQDFAVVPPIRLGLSYAQSPSAVNQPSPAALAFYANARLSGLSTAAYTNAFTISVLYSNDAQACGAVAPPAIYGQTAAAAAGLSVPTPNYTIAFDTLKLVVDGHKVVQNSSSGNIVLKYPAKQGQVGEEWRTFHVSTACCQSLSFSYIDGIYKTSTAAASDTIPSAGDISIPWTSFGLQGLKLPTSQTVIVKHTDSGGVYSYELFQILFPGPPA